MDIKQFQAISKMEVDIRNLKTIKTLSVACMRTEIHKISFENLLAEIGAIEEEIDNLLDMKHQLETRATQTMKSIFEVRRR